MFLIVLLYFTYNIFILIKTRFIILEKVEIMNIIIMIEKYFTICLYLMFFFLKKFFTNYFFQKMLHKF